MITSQVSYCVSKMHNLQTIETPKKAKTIKGGVNVTFSSCKNAKNFNQSSKKSKIRTQISLDARMLKTCLGK